MKRIIYDYENPHIVGKASKSFPLAKIIVTVIVIALAVALIYILFFRKTSYYIENKAYYTVVSGEYDSESEAIRAAAEIKSRGGGGYVLKGSKYAVIVAVYDSRENAEAVADRYDYRVNEIGKYTLKVEIDNEYGKEAAELSAYPQQIIDTLYTTSISLDKGELSSAATLYSLDKLIESVDENTVRVSKIKGKLYSNDLIDRIEIMYGKLKSSLSNAGAEESVSVGIKYCLIELTYIYKNFLNGNKQV